VAVVQRIGVHDYFLQIASTVAKRATCVRRSVGCVLVNDKNHIIATGYNGVESKAVHCLDSPCEGAFDPRGERKGKCSAIHAEDNAIRQCLDSESIQICYTTISPCPACIKKLLDTPCKAICFSKYYSNHDGVLAWLKAGRVVIHNGILMRDRQVQ